MGISEPVGKFVLTGKDEGPDTASIQSGRTEPSERLASPSGRLALWLLASAS